MEISSNNNEATQDTIQTKMATSSGGGGDVVGEEKNRVARWWRSAWDGEEAKVQFSFALPMFLTNLAYSFIPLVSIMFAGHIGELELAGSTLANSWFTVTGVAFMTGLSGALETLCGQSYGAKSYRMLGIYLQSACIISFMFCILITILWIFSEPVLRAFHQAPDIAKASGIYIRYLIPGVYAAGLLQNVLRFLQTQSVVWPLVILSVLPMGIHVGLAYALVNKTSLGYEGAALSASISLWLSAIILSSYVLFSKRFKETWTGFSFESLAHIVITLKLGVYSAAMVCLEYWAFEILVFVAGVMPNSQVSTSLIAIALNTELVAYMLIYGLSAAVSTRVSNELGAGNPRQAKQAMFMTLKLVTILAFFMILAIIFGHDLWSGFFSNSREIREKFGHELAPFIAISVALDGLQGVLSGALRGCGWQHLAVYTNFVTFYLIGILVGCLLGFKAKLYVKGLWIGLICGLAAQSSVLFFVTVRTKWVGKEPSKEDTKAENGSSVVA